MKMFSSRKHESHTFGLFLLATSSEPQFNNLMNSEKTRSTRLRHFMPHFIFKNFFFKPVSI